jgi:uncharacterized protein YegJ (DUF2314 family)
MIRLVFAVLFFFNALALMPAIAQAEPEETSASDLVWGDDDDPALQRAYDEARGSLSHFWDVFDARDHEEIEPLLKVGLPTNDNSLEYIWVYPLSRDDGEYSGILANDPYNLKGDLQSGSEVSFEREDIADWTYWDGEKMRGQFTTRVLLVHMSEADAEEQRAILHDQPLP